MQRVEPGLAGADRAPRPVAPLRLRLQCFALAPQIAMLGRATHYRQQLFVLEWFLDVVEGAVVHRADRRLQARLRRHQNYDGLGVVRANRGQDVETGDVGHSDVRDYQLWLQRSDLLETFLSAKRRVRDEPLVLEQNAYRVENAHLVIDDENRRSRRCDPRHFSLFATALGVFRVPSLPSLGRNTVNLVPARLPCLSTRMKPCCASTARCTIERPSPVPPTFVVTNG